MPASSSGFTASDVPDQTGKCFVITGANSGVGLEATRVLAERGARVILACRDARKAEEAIAHIRASVAGADLSFLAYDQADLDSIRDATARLQHEPRIDVLVNNAGVMYPPLLRTRQGFELQFGVNHLGCYALSLLMLPKLAATSEPRIVVTSSVAHKMARLDFDDLNAFKSYSKTDRYHASKLANALFFFELDRRLREVGSPLRVVGCHPGFASTGLARHNPVTAVLMRWLRPFMNSAASGAWPTLQAATGPVRSGEYYGPSRFFETSGPSGPASRSAQATNPAIARRLWEVSAEMTGIDLPN